MYIIEVCLGDKKYPLRLEKYFDIFSWSVNEHFPKAVVVDKKHETYSQINSTSTVTPYPYNKRSYTFCGGYSQQLLYKIKNVSLLQCWVRLSSQLLTMLMSIRYCGEVTSRCICVHIHWRNFFNTFECMHLWELLLFQYASSNVLMNVCLQWSEERKSTGAWR